jgi:hypothetical protein
VGAERFGHWLDRKWNQVEYLAIPLLSALGGITIALSRVTDQSGRVVLFPGHPDQIIVLVSGLFLTLFGAIIGPIRNRQNSLAAGRLRAIEAKFDSAKFALLELSRLELADLFERLNYSTNERISLFMPARDNSCLGLVARYAISQQYLSAGRHQYPLDQGCLGRAWRDREGVAIDLPDPQVQYEEWRRCLWENWQIPVDVSARFQMRSRTCIAFGILPSLKPCQGVIVFESQTVSSAGSNQFLDPDRLRRRLKQKGGERDKLIRLLEILERLQE